MDEHTASAESSGASDDTEPLPVQHPVDSVPAAPPVPPLPVNAPEPLDAATSPGPLHEPSHPEFQPVDGAAPPSTEPAAPSPAEPVTPSPTEPATSLSTQPGTPPSTEPAATSPTEPATPPATPPSTDGAAGVPPTGGAVGPPAYGVAEQPSMYNVTWAPPPTDVGTAPAPAEPRVPSGPPRSPGVVALFNLTGLGLGYWYLGRRLRAWLSLAVTAVLVITAFATDAAGRPWLWRAVAAGWVAWMVFDGWRLARRHPDRATAPKRRPALVATAVIAVIVAGYALYSVGGNRAFASGEAAQAAGDCKAAVARYDWVTGPYELTLSGNVAAAERNRAYCSAFEFAVAEHERQHFDKAVDLYHEFLDSTPPNSLDDHVHDRLQHAYLEWGHSARTAGDDNAAIKAFRSLLQEYRDGWGAKQARSELAQTYFDEAAAYRKRFDPAYSLGLASDVRETMQKYLMIQEEFPETASAREVPKAIVDTFNEAVQPFAAGKFCESLPVLDYLVTLPPDQSAGVVGMAHEDHVKANFECGVLRYGSKDFDEAIEHFKTIVDSYPQHALANAARSALIAATIAAAGPKTIPPLPPPLGDNTPGTIGVLFYNDTSVATEVLISGPTAHRFVLPGCPSCPEGYDNNADACKSGPAGRPVLVLLLQPGDYQILHRDAGDETLTRVAVGTISVRSNDYLDTLCLYRGRA